ncbi:MAG: ribosome small subunit-dependent GTPase A [Candidatus Ancillula sp.]|jgi:ribosome biogenesis GTPase|nr:ribosome small subunit-dependent GTPase A [Candidatus Ancillula sp.]
MNDFEEYEKLEMGFERATSKRSSRPRTKLVKANINTTEGVVIESQRGRYIISSQNMCRVTAVKSSRLRNFSIVCGDLVKFKEGEDLARIVEVLPRKSVLVRTADDTKCIKKTIAANTDYCLILVSTINPKPQEDFIRRCIISAESGNTCPILVITKTDLCSLGTNILQIIDEVQVFDSHADYDRLLKVIESKTVVLVGLSGVGKSTLINRIVPNAARKTSEVSKNGDGRHTSTSSCAFYAGTTLIIDTPGIRSFGLGHLDNK